LKILTVSDRIEPKLLSPGQASRLGPIDLLLSCGDLPPEYLSGLVEVFGVPLFYVCGNHDIRHADKSPMGGTDLHGRLCRFGGHSFLGFAGSRWYNGGPYQCTEAQMRWTVWKMFPRIWLQGGIEIVITHAPPRHIHDAEDTCHRGFGAYRALIERFAPRYFLHGHIHALFANSDQRITRLGQTLVINCYGHYVFEI
jgi:Icc-related predicted phosphoesterase